MKLSEDKLIENLKKEASAETLKLDIKYTKSGVIVLPTFRNAIIYLQTDDNIAGLFRHNEFAHRAETHRRPPWGAFGAYPCPITDRDIIHLREYLANQYDVDFSMANLNDAVSCVADKSSYDPVKDYLTSLKWDQTPRIDTWLTEYLGAEDNEYTRFVGKMTLAGACARVDKPGIKYDYMLILEGDQGIGKSQALKVLGGEWFSEMSLTDRTKDTVEKMQGAWIIEVAELAVFKKKDIESLKAFITQTTDLERLPYGRRSTHFPRRNIFIGTINPGSGGYLSDNTGNRRFLPVACNGINIPKLMTDRDQIWAEAWQAYKNKTHLWLSEEVSALSITEQEYREIGDSWIEVVEEYVEDKDMVTSMQVWIDGLKGAPDRFGRVETVRIGDCLRKLGWQSQTVRVDEKSVRGWRRTTKAAPIKQKPSGQSFPWED